MSLNLGRGSAEMGSVPAVGAGARTYGTAGNSGLSRTEKSLGSAPPQPVNRSSADLRRWKAVSRTWTARRSAGSPLGDLLPLSQSPAVNRMRRSMSFERVATSYLSSEWPRTTCNLHNNRLNLLRCHVILTTDKWTQTSEDIDNQDSGSSKTCVHSKLPLSCLENSDRLHSFKERKMTSSALEINNATHFGRSDIRTIFDNVLQYQAVPATRDCGRNLVTPNQSSAEGFNQEVENLVENTGIIDSEESEMKSACMQTPDGHRAPVAELLSMGCCQSVRRMLSMSPLISDVENHFVRIPEDVVSSGSDPLLLIIPDPFGSASSSSAAAPVSHSHSTGRMLEKMCQQPSNVIISPSPVIHKSLRKRQAPDGSELEDGMLTNLRANVNNNNFSSPVTTSNLSRCNIPSEHSAFCPLLKKYVGKKSLWMVSVSSGAEAEAQ